MTVDDTMKMVSRVLDERITPDEACTIYGIARPELDDHIDASQAQQGLSRCHQCQAYSRTDAVFLRDGAKTCGACLGLGFNAGAFSFAPVWLLFHGKWMLGVALIVINLSWLGFALLAGAITGATKQVLVFQALWSLGVSAYFGTRGDAIAMNHGRYPSVREMKQKERGWTIAGWTPIVATLLIALFVAGGNLFLYFARL